MRTTIAVGSSTRNRLAHLKRAWGTRSIDEVLGRLLGGTPSGARALYLAHKEALDEVLSKHRVRRLVAFGSRARGDERPDSDLDLVATLPRDTSLLDVALLKEDLEEVVGLSVNLFTPEALDEDLKRSVREEGVVLVQ